MEEIAKTFIEQCGGRRQFAKMLWDDFISLPADHPSKIRIYELILDELRPKYLKIEEVGKC